MLELLVSLRRTRGGGEIGGAARTEQQTGAYAKEVGDVVAVKRSPAVWGRMEKRMFLIAYYEDDELEQEMAAHEVIIHPFQRQAPFDGVGAEIVERGSYQVDIGMFAGSDGLNAEIECGAVAPGGKPHLEFTDLMLRGPSPSSKKDAILLDSTGLKAHLAADLVGDRFNVVDHTVLTYEDKVWRHGLEVPGGHSIVDVTDIVQSACAASGVPSSTLQYPRVSDLIDRGVPHADLHNAQYVIYGRRTKLPGALRRALGQNAVLVAPLLGWTDEQVQQEVDEREMPYEDMEYEIEGVPIHHRRYTGE